MHDKPDPPRRRSRLVTFGLALLGITVILGGTLLVVLDTSGAFEVSAFGLTLPPETPGLVTIALGFLVLVKSGRSTG